jgi:sporulation protein YqfD
MVEVELTSADPSSALHAINFAGITVFNARQIGDLTLRFLVQRRNYRKLHALAKKRGEMLQFSSKKGLYWVAKQILRRPILVLGCLLILWLTLFLPSHIYFVEVEGNITLPARLIIEKADECGLSFGTHRREVRSEKMKNALLQAIPELQWAGINTYGCRAVISVRERTVPEKQNITGAVSSIVAARDGVIQELIVQRGNAACKVGQAVKEGQVLISGYSDLGICIRATQAQGDVFAQTRRHLTAVSPSQSLQRGQTERQVKKYSLIIGKKQINFCKDSGISDSSCDKMYSVNYITLPGGFKLPIALVTEVWTWYDTSPGQINEEKAGRILSDFSGHYLTGIMTAGQIQQRREVIQHADGIYILQGQFACVEMIGKTRLEENLDNYGENH